MNQPIPPDVEIPTLHQTVPSHWRTHPLEIPWVTERAPQPDASSQSPLAVPSAGSATTLTLAASLAASQPALSAPLDESSADPASNESEAVSNPPAASEQTPEFEIEQLVNQVIQATTAHAQQAEDAQSDAEHQVLANQVVERVQARIASLLPDLVHEVISEIQPGPTDTGKPSEPQELK